jgi:hypothetical protein
MARMLTSQSVCPTFVSQVCDRLAEEAVTRWKADMQVNPNDAQCERGRPHSFESTSIGGGLHRRVCVNCRKVLIHPEDDSVQDPTAVEQSSQKKDLVLLAADPFLPGTIG